MANEQCIYCDGHGFIVYNTVILSRQALEKHGIYEPNPKGASFRFCECPKGRSMEEKFQLGKIERYGEWEALWEELSQALPPEPTDEP